MYDTFCLLWWVWWFYLLSWVFGIVPINATLLGQTVFWFLEHESWFLCTLVGGGHVCTLLVYLQHKYTYWGRDEGENGGEEKCINGGEDVGRDKGWAHKNIYGGGVRYGSGRGGINAGAMARSEMATLPLATTATLPGISIPAIPGSSFHP